MRGHEDGTHLPGCHIGLDVNQLADDRSGWITHGQPPAAQRKAVNPGLILAERQGVRQYYRGISYLDDIFQRRQPPAAVQQPPAPQPEPGHTAAVQIHQNLGNPAEVLARTRSNHGTVTQCP
jgi:hypothetical protein